MIVSNIVPPTGGAVNENSQFLNQKEFAMRGNECLKKTAKFAVGAAVIVALIPVGLCFLGLWGYCVGGGDIKSC